ncbi:MAG: SAM-dependent methyltransferase [Clostridiaceae bacterium]|nr:SAM-dependent methyltransferase [Clostridiaceae bacterium]
MTISEALDRIFSRPLTRLTLSCARRGEFRKVMLRPVVLREQQVYQLEKRTDTQAFHENLSPGQVREAVERLLSDFAQLDAAAEGMLYSLKLSQKGKVFFSETPAKTIASVPTAHNRQKNYLLPEGVAVPALVDLGVMTSDGRVVQSKYDKYRQINRFLEYLADLPLESDGHPLRVVDFGCGKSYLTFVVYYYLTELRKLPVEIIGLDLKRQVIEDCSTVAEKYGYSHLRFLCCDIKDYVPDTPPDLVISLHACDTATDHALFNAVTWGARFILSAPCCQHELNLSTGAGAFPPLTGYGILKERFCALATDALRCKLLEWQGYDTQILEFIDLAHSPKNLLIRAKKGGVSPAARQKSLEEAETLLRQLGGENTLYRRLKA